jgi:putative flippase GtrA
MENSHFITFLLKEARYVMRYLGSGVFNSIVGFSVIFIAMALGISPMLSNILGYVFGLTLAFTLSKKFVFRSNGHVATESVRFLVAFMIAFLVNLFVLHVSLVYLNLQPVISQLAAAASYTSLMYLLSRYFVFDPARSNG